MSLSRLPLRLTLLALLAGCSAQSPTEQPPVTDGPRPTLGVAFPPTATPDDRAFTLGTLEDLCMTHVRFGQQWAFREPERDRFVWGPLDARLDAFARADVEVFLTLEIKGLPDWVAALSRTDREAEFQEYVRALLDRTAGRLAAVQLGNEWNWEVDRHLGGDTDAFIELATILYEEVARRPEDDRPEVVLGSLSIGGLHGLALAQGRIDNVFFDGAPLYSPDEVAAARADAPAYLSRLRAVFGRVPFDAVDLHFYDDVWNWGVYREAAEQLLRDAGMSPDTVAFVASEFGGPHPRLEPSGEVYAATQVARYVRALGEIGVERAYLFQLAEEPGAQIAHPNSFLVRADGRRTAAFEALADIGCR